MVNIRRTRLKAIRAGVPVIDANKVDSIPKLIKLMQKLPNTPTEAKEDDAGK